MYYKEDFKTFLDRDTDYNFAIVDPPWNYTSKPRVLTYNQLTYSLWDNNDLSLIFQKLNVDYIFLWVTNSFIPNAIKASEGTAFNYKTMFTWVKTTKKGGLAWGLGNTFRNCTEHLMVFQKKKAACLNLNTRNCVMARNGKRTMKPKVFERDLVERLENKGLKGVYLFSGTNLDFIDSVDIAEENS